MNTNLNDMARQFRGAKFAELILVRTNGMDTETGLTAMAGLMSELPENLSGPVLELIDFLVEMPQSDLKQFFGGDCGEKFIEMVNVIRGFMLKKQITLSDEEAFTIFSIVVENYAHACRINSQTKAAMQKASGVGFLGRLFKR